MSFKKDSKSIMDYMLNHFKNEYDESMGESVENIYTNIYKSIQQSDESLKILVREGKLHKNVKEGNHIANLKKSELFNSRFVPQYVKKFIESNTVGIVSYSIKIKDRALKFNFYLMDNGQYNELPKLNNLVNKMITAFIFLSERSKRTCSETLSVNIYLTPLKKLLPDTNTKILGSKHANSAVTTHCSTNAEIMIYRSEEIFKVFIHESIHSLGLDWFEMPVTNLKTKIQKIYDINSDMNLPEAYTEFWACVLNSCFSSYYLNKNDCKEFIKFVNYCIQFEKIFSLFQAAKILRFMGLTYSSLYENDDVNKQARKYLYNEDTNIFVYYILKTVLLYNSSKFLMLCDKNNKKLINYSETEHNMNCFYKFIKENHNNGSFLKDMLEMYGNVRTLYNKSSNNFLKTTMRMSVIELT